MTPSLAEIKAAAEEQLGPGGVGGDQLARHCLWLVERVEELEKALRQACMNLATCRLVDDAEETLGDEAERWRQALLAGWGGALGFKLDRAALANLEESR